MAIPIDVLVANTRPIVPGAVINVRPIGVLKMVDEAGGDEKILAVPVPRLTKRYEHVMNYTDLPAITLEQVQHFFEHYKDLEPGKWVKTNGWGDAAEAKQLIRDAIARAKSARLCRASGQTATRCPEYNLCWVCASLDATYALRTIAARGGGSGRAVATDAPCH